MKRPAWVLPLLLLLLAVSVLLWLGGAGRPSRAERQGSLANEAKDLSDLKASVERVVDGRRAAPSAASPGSTSAPQPPSSVGGVAR